jgi:hypothetical protein
MEDVTSKGKKILVEKQTLSVIETGALKLKVLRRFRNTPEDMI